jgi:DinB superfamily
MTPSEREGLLQDLDQTRETLLHAVRGLSPQQLEYHEADQRWSIAENLEHISVAEHGILSWIQNALGDAPASALRGDWDGRDDALRDKFEESRHIQFQAPEVIRPTGRWPLAELVPKFEAARTRTRGFIASTDVDLRRNSRPHPKFGLLDCYQWLILIGMHCDRHRAQIEKVKASPGFPH